MNQWLDEHIRPLTQLSGISPEEAKYLFDRPLAIMLDPVVRENPTYRLAFSYAVNLLTRLFPGTHFDELGEKALLILPWGGSSPLPATSPNRPQLLVFGRPAQHPEEFEGVVTANCHDWQVYIDASCEPDPQEAWNPVLALITACYAAARVTKHLLNDAVEGPEGTWQPFSVLDFRKGSVEFDWRSPLDIGDVHLAGIGAVGSATLFALAAHGVAKGRLVLLDHDVLERKKFGPLHLL